MPKPDHDPSVEREPHFADRPATPDPSERAADAALEKGGGERDREEASAGQSVFDEPDILPGRAPETIDRDWSCGNCGYNLRGLTTGQRCPECGQVELYRPPPPDQVSYGAWYRRQQAAASSLRGRCMFVLAALFAAPAAFACALVTAFPAPFTVFIFAPITEEAAKIIAIALLVDTRPFLAGRAGRLWAAAVLSGVSFAVVHNTVSLGLIVSRPSLALILCRWIGGPLLHVACTLVAARGVVAVWELADREARRPKITRAVGAFLLAVQLHVGINVLLYFWVGPGYVF